MPLVIEAGARLSFEANAGLVCSGRLAVEGNRDEPVVLEAKNPKKGWAGVVRLPADETVELTHLEVTGARGFARRGWRTRAALAISGGTAHIDELSIARSRADAAIRLSEITAAIGRLRIAAADANGLVLASARGAIDRIEARDVARDAVEIVASEFEIAELRVERAGDAAIALRGDTRAKLEHLRVAGASVGAACSQRRARRSRKR